MSNPTVNQVQTIISAIKDNKLALVALKPIIAPVIDDPIKNDNGKTLLIWAAKSGYELVVEVLLEFGAQVDKQDNNQNTPLIWAVYGGQEKIVDMLLKAGALLDIQDDTKFTALHWAVERRNFNMFYHILLQGASTTLKNRDDDTVVSMLRKKPDSETKTKILNLLKEKGKLEQPVEIVQPATQEQPVETAKPATQEQKPEQPVETAKPATQEPVQSLPFQQIIVYMMAHQIDFKYTGGQIETVCTGTCTQLEELAMFMFANNTSFISTGGQIKTI